MDATYFRSTVGSCFVLGNGLRHIWWLYFAQRTLLLIWWLWHSFWTPCLMKCFLAKSRNFGSSGCVLSNGRNIRLQIVWSGTYGLILVHGFNFSSRGWFWTDRYGRSCEDVRIQVHLSVKFSGRIVPVLPPAVWNLKPAHRGLYFGPKTIFIPLPPCLKMIFFPLSRHIVFRLPSWPFCLNSSLFCNYFTPLTSPFLLFFPLSSFLFSLSSIFFYIFPPFSLHLFIFCPPNDIGWYFPLPGGGGSIFQYIAPCTPIICIFIKWLSICWENRNWKTKAYMSCFSAARFQVENLMLPPHSLALMEC